jgi:hypothetical protein
LATEELPQIKLTAKLKENSVGGEILTFVLNLEFFQLIFIVNIPSEGETESVVYCKFKLLMSRG